MMWNTDYMQGLKTNSFGLQGTEKSHDILRANNAQETVDKKAQSLSWVQTELSDNFFLLELPSDRDSILHHSLCLVF